MALLALLVAHHAREARAPDDARMTLIFIDALPRTASPTPPAHAPRRARGAAITAVPVPELPAGESVAIEPSAAAPDIDWYAQGSDVAERAARPPTTRSFDLPKREPAPRARKPFGWDRTHTERVHALDGGGIGIHLSDNCELVLAPLPMAGCGIGKRKARGDLFDEMQAPPEMGDWKER